MKFRRLLAVCFVLVGALAASAADPAVRTIAFDDLHIRVPDPAKAGEWYVKYLGATPTQSPHRVSFGRTLIIFSKGENPGPSTVIDVATRLSPGISLYAFRGVRGTIRPAERGCRSKDCRTPQVWLPTVQPPRRYSQP